MRGFISALSLLAIFLFAALQSTVGQAQSPEVKPSEIAPNAMSPAAKPGQVILLDIDGAIGPATADYLRRGFGVAKERNASAILLRIDTPGGLVTSMRDIIRDIVTSDIPVIAYVGPSGARAASAGTYIVYASHFAAMAPGTHLGAATPVAIGGGLPQQDQKDGKDKPEPGPREKAINDAVAYIQGLASLRSRNAEWAERAVREAATATAPNALKLGVIEAISPNVEDVLAKADGVKIDLPSGPTQLRTSGLAIEAVEPNWREQFLAVITNPNIAYILLLLGIYGLILEALTPGTIGPGVLGAIALLTGAYALNLLPISFAGAALLLLGIALMVAEALMPTFGILGIGGIAAFALGSLFLFEGEIPGFTLSWELVALATAASICFLIIALRVVWRASRRAVTTGSRALIGSIGHVVQWDRDEGYVHVHGEQWRAQSKAALAPGQTIRVTGRQDLTLLVEPGLSSPPKT